MMEKEIDKWCQLITIGWLLFLAGGFTYSEVKSVDWVFVSGSISCLLMIIIGVYYGLKSKK